MNANSLSVNLKKMWIFLMVPVAVLLPAMFMKLLGDVNVFNLPWMQAAGEAILNILPLLLAVAIAIGLAEENNGVAGLAAVAGYLVLTNVAATFDKKIDMGLIGGFIIGLLAGVLYNTYKSIRVPAFLGFFGGKRFVPIITAFYALIIGIIAGYTWPFLARIPFLFMLRHILYTFAQFLLQHHSSTGELFTGNPAKLFALDMSAFLTRFFLIIIFTTSTCMIMLIFIPKNRKNAKTGLLVSTMTASYSGNTVSRDNLFANFQKLGKALMTPIAVLPAAAILQRLGDVTILNIPWMYAAGKAVFANLPLLMAVGIAIGLAEDNQGVAGFAAVVGYFVLTKVATTFNSKIDMEILPGFIIGLLAGFVYNKHKTPRLPAFLEFFGDQRFTPIIVTFYSLIIGIISGYIWPYIQNAVTSIGNSIATSGSVGGFFFGIFNRLLIPFGLHQIINTFAWFQLGQFRTLSGKVVTGDLARFYAGDPHAGTFMTGFFPIMMFALPSACIAMIATARKRHKKAVTGMLLSVALTSFLTGITEPIEFLFMFLSPVLYLIHAVLTGLSLAITSLFGMRCGFGFSAGFIDFILNYGITSHPMGILAVGLVFGFIYYFTFMFFIKRFNIPTPGRTDDEESFLLAGLPTRDLKIRAAEMLEAIGGKHNIFAIDACVTRIRLSVKNPVKVDEEKLKELGVTGILKLPGNNFQIVVGTVADPLVTHLKKLLK